jgi:hypothetical protein
MMVILNANLSFRLQRSGMPESTALYDWIPTFAGMTVTSEILIAG